MSVRWIFGVRVLAALALAFSPLVSLAPAADILWNVAGPANWSDANNWNPAQVPVAADNAFINNDGTADINSAVPNIAGLRVGSAANSTLRVQPGAAITIERDIFLGKDTNPIGTIEQTGGDVVYGSLGAVDALQLGWGAGTVGTYKMTGGTLTQGGGFLDWNNLGYGGGTGNLEISAGTITMNGRLHLGRGGGGQGNITQTGGSIFVGDTSDAADIVIGDDVNTVNTYTMSGGTLGTSGGMAVGHWDSGGTGSTGLFDVTNGADVTIAHELIVANRGTGLMTIDGAGSTVTARDLIIKGNQDVASSGILTVQNGALLTLSGFGHVGRTQNGTGNLTISGGDVDIGTNLTVGTNGNSVGTLDVQAGTLDVGDSLVVAAGGSGTFTLSGGTVTADRLAVATGSSSTGSVIHSGGTLTAPIIDIGTGGTGTYNLDAGVTLNSTTVTIGGGANGALLANGTLNATSVDINSGGFLRGVGTVNSAVDVNAGGAIQPGDGGPGTLTVGDLTMGLGSSLVMELGANPGPPDSGLISADDLAYTAGPMLVTLIDLGYANGTYPLVDYSGTSTGALDNVLFITSNPLFGYTADDDGSALNVIIGAPAASIEWQPDGGVDSGNWSDAAHWVGGVVPSGLDAFAEFGTLVTGATTVTVDGARTVGRLEFDNAFSSYTIVGSPITLDTSGGSASIALINGSHTIDSNLVVNKNTLVTVGAGLTLTASGDISGAGGKGIVLNGGGSLDLSGAVSLTGTLLAYDGTITQQPGAAVSVDSAGFGTGASVYNLNNGTLTVATNVYGGVGTLNINGGTLSLTNASANVSTGTVNIGTGGATGALTLTGARSMTLSGGMNVGTGGGTGAFTHSSTGAVSMVGDLHVGGDVGSTGTITMNSGSLSANLVRIGRDGGTGTFTQNGGDVTFATGAGVDPLDLGLGAGSSGTYTMNGGTLTQAAGNTEWNNIGRGGVGKFELNSGTVVLGGRTLLGRGGSGQGTVIQKGGSSVTITGAVSNEMLVIGDDVDTVNTYDISEDSQLSVTNSIAVGHWAGGAGFSTGIFNVTGGSDVTSTNELIVAFRGTGIMTMDGAGTTMTSRALEMKHDATTSGTALLTVQNDAVLTTTQHARIGRTTNGSAELNIGDPADSDVGTNPIVNIGTQVWTGDDAGAIGTVNIRRGEFNVGDTLRFGQRGLGTFNVSGGTTTALNIYAGVEGGSTGIITQTGGDIIAQPGQGWVVLGDLESSSGTYNMSGGTLTSTNDGIFVGQDGYGEFNISGTALVTTPRLEVQRWTAADGGVGSVVNQSGGDVLISGLNLVVAHQGNGDVSEGTYNLSGGTLTQLSANPGDAAQWNYIGQDAGSLGKINVDGGVLTLGARTTIGAGGTGIITQTDGDVIITAPSQGATEPILAFGDGGGTGTYTISGGNLSLTAGSAHVGHWQGTGFLNVSGTGNVSIAEDLRVGALANGNPTGTVEQTGGTVTVGNDVEIANKFGQGGVATGTYNLKGGTLDVTGSISGGDGVPDFNFTGGTLKTGVFDTTNLGGTLVQQNTDSASLLDVSDRNTTIAGGAGQGNYQLVDDNAQISNEFVLFIRGNLEVDEFDVIDADGDNGLITISGQTDSAPNIVIYNQTSIDDLWADVISGYGTGSWDGTGGITTTDVVDINLNGLGLVAETDDLFFGGPGDPYVGVREMILGDFNGDDFVDSGDATVLFGNLGNAATWLTGDANYDAFADAGDATVLFGHLGQSYDASMGPLSAVPEPGTFVLAALGLAGMGFWVGGPRLWGRRRKAAK